MVWLSEEYPEFGVVLWTGKMQGHGDGGGWMVGVEFVSIYLYCTVFWVSFLYHTVLYCTVLFLYRYRQTQSSNKNFTYLCII